LGGLLHGQSIHCLPWPSRRFIVQPFQLGRMRVARRR
jgi:hypothetical protein